MHWLESVHGTQTLLEHFAFAAVGQSESLTHSTQVPPEGFEHTFKGANRVHCDESVQVTHVLLEHLAFAIVRQSVWARHSTQVPPEGFEHFGVEEKRAH